MLYLSVNLLMFIQYLFVVLCNVYSRPI